MPPPYELSYEYSPDLARRVGLQLAWRRYAGYLLSMLAIPVCLAVGLGAPEVRSLCIFGFGLWSCLALRLLQAFLRKGRAARSLGRLKVRLELGEEGWLTETEQISSRAQWATIGRVTALSSALIIERRGYSDAMFIPATAFSAEARAFFERKVREAGGVVA